MNHFRRSVEQDFTLLKFYILQNSSCYCIVRFLHNFIQKILYGRKLQELFIVIRVYMQITDAQKRRVAVFFIAGALIFIGTAAVLVGNRVMKRENCYYTEFKDLSVSGLTEGSSVKFQGMKIGQVRGISIDKNDTTVIRVRMCLKPDIPIKRGTFANLGSIGITGLKYIELKGGGSGKDIEVNGLIPGKKSDWDKITGQATVITTKIEAILNKTNRIVSSVNDDSLRDILKDVKSITSRIDRILEKNDPQISSILARTDSILKKLDKNLPIVQEISKDLKSITADLTRITSPKGPLEKVLDNLEKGTEKFAKSELIQIVKNLNNRSKEEQIFTVEKAIKKGWKNFYLPSEKEQNPSKVKRMMLNIVKKF